MTGEFWQTIQTAWNRVDLADRRVTNTADRTNVVGQLRAADYISLSALCVAWGSVLLLFAEEPNWALLAMFAAFFLDKLDGWYARRQGISSPFGRQVDSFIDIFAYLVPAALLYHLTMSPTVYASLPVGFLVLACGGLRLIRHNNEGFGSDGGASYYHGTTVVHTNLVVVANYVLVVVLSAWNGWFAGATIAISCPFMISNYKAYKTTVSHVLAGASALLASALAIAIELGYL